MIATPVVPTAVVADAGELVIAGTSAAITATAARTPNRRFIRESMLPPCWLIEKTGPSHRHSQRIRRTRCHKDYGTTKQAVSIPCKASVKPM